MASYILLCAAAGRSTITKGTKSLFRHDGMAVLEHQVRTIRSFDKDADIVVVAGFQANKILKLSIVKEMDIRIVVNSDYKLTSQSDSLRMGLNALRPSSFYIIHGDIIFNAAALDGPQTCTFVSVDNGFPESRSVGIGEHHGVVLHMSYGLENKWAQIAHINEDIFFYTKSLLNATKSHKMTYEIINLLVQEGPVMAHKGEAIRTLEISKTYDEVADHL